MVKSCSWTALISPVLAPCSISARSMPAQNDFPLAVSRIAPTAGSREASSSAVTRLRQSAASRALRLSGRLRVSRNRRPSRTECKKSVIVCGVGGRSGGAEHAVGLIIIPRHGKWGSTPAREEGIPRVPCTDCRVEGSGAVAVSGPEHTDRQLVTQIARCEGSSSYILTKFISVAYRQSEEFCDANGSNTGAEWHQGVRGGMLRVMLGAMVHQTPSKHRYSTASGQFWPSGFGSD